VSFISRDIELDEGALDEYSAKTGGRTGVPVTDIDGEIVFGFDRKKIDELLKEKGLVAA
jgi:hypothetical protein